MTQEEFLKEIDALTQTINNDLHEANKGLKKLRENYSEKHLDNLDESQEEEANE